MNAGQRGLPAGQHPLPDFGTVFESPPTLTENLSTAKSDSIVTVKGTANRTKGKAKVPRPPNAFILYRQEHHPRLKTQYPDMRNNDICKKTSRKTLVVFD